MDSIKPKLNQLKIGVLMSYLQIILGVLISIIYTPFLLRLLGQSEYGLYILVTSIVGYLSILSLGFGGSYVRFYSRFKVNSEYDKIATLNGIYIIFFSIISLLTVAIGIVLYFNSNSLFGTNLTELELGKAKILLSILIVNVAISFPNIVFKNYIIANEKFVFEKFLNLSLTILNPSIILILLLFSYRSIAMSISVTVISFIINAINAFFCLKKLNMKFSFTNLDFSLFKEIFVFSSFIFISIITVNINWNLDKYLLGRFWGTVAVAVYAIGALLNFHYLNLSKAISNVFIPRINKLVADDENNPELTNLFIKVGRIQFLVMFLILSGFYVFGREFITMWAGLQYYDAYIIVLLLMSSVIVPSIQTLGIEIQKAKNIHKFRSLVYFFIALCNLAITIPLAKAYGGIGAAIGTVFSQIVGECIIMNVFYHKKVKINMIVFWKEILFFLPSLIIPLSFGISIKYFIDISSVSLFLIWSIFYAITYITSIWFLGLNKYEKKLIITPLKKLKQNNKFINGLFKWL